MAKEALRKHLDKRGWYTNIKESRGVDIKAYTSKLVPCDHEVEVKLVWDGEWPDEWTDVHIPERKRQLIKTAADKGHDLVFWILNKDLTRAIRILGKEVKDELLKVIPNKRVRYGEQFFCVPLDRCTFVDIT